MVSRTRLTLMMKISWALQIISSCIAIFVTVLYWSLVHSYVIKYGVITDDADWVFTFFFHAFNTLFIVTDLFISASPVSLHHAYLPIIYGLLYSLFSLLYWVAGGEGICTANCHQEGPEILPPACPVECSHYIYPMLDWRDQPLVALLVSAGGSLAVILSLALLYAIYRVREGFI